MDDSGRNRELGTILLRMEEINNHISDIEDALLDMAHEIEDFDEDLGRKFINLVDDIYKCRNILKDKIYDVN